MYQFDPGHMHHGVMNGFLESQEPAKDSYMQREKNTQPSML